MDIALWTAAYSIERMHTRNRQVICEEYAIMSFLVFCVFFALVVEHRSHSNYLSATVNHKSIIVKCVLTSSLFAQHDAYVCI